MNSKRYNRQILLEQIGTAGQAQLAQSRVLCIGAGGLGAPALLYLAGAGIGTIGIVDYDTVDESNLHRQIIFTEKDLGELKAEAAAEHLKALNPGCNAIPYTMRFTAQNAAELVQSYDLVIDGSDNFTTKYLINDICYKLSKAFIFGSALGLEARVATFAPDNTKPCYRCLYPDAPTTYVANCSEAGVLGPVVGMAGAYQATEALKYLLQAYSPTPLFPDIGQTLWVFDALHYETHMLHLPKNKECSTCSHDRAAIILEDGAASYMQEESFLTPQELKEHTDIQLIDVREADEFNTAHIPSALSLPLTRLQTEGVDIALLPKDKTIVLYCQHGVRSREAAALFKKHGQKVYQLRGGIEGYL